MFDLGGNNNTWKIDGVYSTQTPCKTGLAATGTGNILEVSNFNSMINDAVAIPSSSNREAILGTTTQTQPAADTHFYNQNNFWLFLVIVFLSLIALFFPSIFEKIKPHLPSFDK